MRRARAVMNGELPPDEDPGAKPIKRSVATATTGASPAKRTLKPIDASKVKSDLILPIFLLV